MRLFPIMAEYGGRIKEHTTDYIPFEVVYPHKEQAFKNHYQTLERLAERGGLDYSELLAVLEDRPWIKVDQSIAKQRVYKIIMDFER